MFGCTEINSRGAGTKKIWLQTFIFAFIGLQRLKKTKKKLFIQYNMGKKLCRFTLMFNWNNNWTWNRFRQAMTFNLPKNLNHGYLPIKNNNEINKKCSTYAFHQIWPQSYQGKCFGAPADLFWRPSCPVRSSSSSIKVMHVLTLNGFHITDRFGTIY